MSPPCCTRSSGLMRVLSCVFRFVLKRTDSVCEPCTALRDVPVQPALQPVRRPSPGCTGRSDRTPRSRAAPAGSRGTGDGVGGHAGALCTERIVRRQREAVVRVPRQLQRRVVEQLVRDERAAVRTADIQCRENAFVVADAVLCSASLSRRYDSAPPGRLLPRADIMETMPPAKPPRDASNVLVVMDVRRIPSSGTPMPPSPMMTPSSVTWFSRSLMPATEKPIRPLTESSAVPTTPAASSATVFGSRSGSGSRFSSACVSSVDCSPARPSPGGGRCACTLMASSAMACDCMVMLVSSSSSSASRITACTTSPMPMYVTRSR
jgi:hypothetical protein